MSALPYAFLHFPGIGPVKEKWLHDGGVRRWEDLLQHQPLERLARMWPDLQDFARLNMDELEGRDWDFFIRHLDCGDRWRLIHDAWDSCHYLDIETTGLEMDDDITIISVWNGKELRLFVKDENLEDFPDYLLTMPFCVTFNGSTFDVPVIKRYFNLPDFPVPHVDMRWICHRCDLTGGLKSIERQLSLQRPADLQGVDGMEAVQLWHQWTDTRDSALRCRLLRYCAADTIALQHVTARLLQQQTGNYGRFRVFPPEHWELLNRQIPPLASSRTDTVARRQPPEKPLSAAVNTPEELKRRLREFLSRKRTH